MNEDFILKGQDFLINMATPALPEGSDAINETGKCLAANLRDPPERKCVSWTKTTSAAEDLNSFKANQRL